MVTPRGDHPMNFQRRCVVSSVPLGSALRDFEGELTAIFDKTALNHEQLAAVTVGTWAGKPFPEAFRSSSRELSRWRATPLDPMPLKGAFEGDGERFVYFYIEPRLGRRGEATIERLRALNVDYRLFLRMVHDQLYAQLLVRVRETVPGRAKWMRSQLEDICDIVRPIIDPDHVVHACQAFQPGGPHYEGFGHFPVRKATLLVNGLTSTISRLHTDGEIFVGFEPGGVPYLIRLGSGAEGDIAHMVFVGTGGSGKSTLMNLVAPQIGGTRTVDISCNASELEASGAWAALVGPDQTPVSLSVYEEDEDLAQGIHFVCVPGSASVPGVREWVVNFITPPGRDLITVFNEDVVPAVGKLLDELDLPEDFPLSFRPAAGCNPALFGAAMSLFWTGVDPWEVTRFSGFRERWGKIRQRDEHLVLKVHDPFRLPQYSGNPNDTGGLFGHSLRQVVFQATSSAHKYNIVVLLSTQSWEDFGAFPPGTLDRFHFVFETSRQEIDGVNQFVADIFNPKHRDELVARILTRIDETGLRRLLTRRELDED